MLASKFTGVLSARIDKRIVMLLLIAGGIALAVSVWFFHDTSEQSRRDAEAFQIHVGSRRIPAREMPRYAPPPKPKAPGAQPSDTPVSVESAKSSDANGASVPNRP